MHRDKGNDLEKSKSESDEEDIETAGWLWRVPYIHQNNSQNGCHI